MDRATVIQLVSTDAVQGNVVEPNAGSTDGSRSVSAASGGLAFGKMTLGRFRFWTSRKLYKAVHLIYK